MSAEMTAAQRKALSTATEIIAELTRRKKQRLADYLYPDADTPRPGFLADKLPCATIPARAKYGRHIEHFAAGARYRERCLMAGNRTGKTLAGAYEVALHLTGRYPEWWEGRRFTGPIRAWAAGKTNETTRDIVQAELLGPVVGSGVGKRLAGTGTVWGDALGAPTWKSGVTNLVDTIPVRHASGGMSWLGLKSYEQGRGAFEGTSQHVIWVDEEPPLDVYGEALVRTATTDGLSIITFTPLEGMSETALAFLPGGAGGA